MVCALAFHSCCKERSELEDPTQIENSSEGVKLQQSSKSIPPTTHNLSVSTPPQPVVLQQPKIKEKTKRTAKPMPMTKSSELHNKGNQVVGAPTPQNGTLNAISIHRSTRPKEN
jgi:hypothetical protein